MFSQVYNFIIIYFTWLKILFKQVYRYIDIENQQLALCVYVNTTPLKFESGKIRWVLIFKISSVFIFNFDQNFITMFLKLS